MNIFCSFTDLPLSPDSPLLNDAADIDFGFDSGIEAEMDEPHGNVFVNVVFNSLILSYIRPLLMSSLLSIKLPPFSEIVVLNSV